MGACRETKNIWWYLFGFNHTDGKWRGRDLFKRKWWKRWKHNYIWHDSVGKYFNRAFMCPLFGHGHVKDISDPGEPKRLHCFKCELDVEKCAPVTQSG